MNVTDELSQASEAYASTFNQGDLPMPPTQRVAVVAYMDARLDVYRMRSRSPASTPARFCPTRTCGGSCSMSTRASSTK